jgi:formamidopyrimidine-DNA glycosylase
LSAVCSAGRTLNTHYGAIRGHCDDVIVKLPRLTSAIRLVWGCEALVALAHRMLDANKKRFGMVTTGAARRGEETWVYGRAGRPCRRCGTPVRSADQGRNPEERITYWCPRCQS